MRRPHPVVLAALAAVLAGCGAAGEPVSPLPLDPPAASASPTPTVAPAPTAAFTGSPPRGGNTPRPPSGTTGGPTSDPACLGPVRYDIDVPNTELELVRSLCFRAGGVLHLRNIGPGLVEVSPEALVSRSYEAGVHDIRFVRTGTVTVTIPKDDRVHEITVVVVE